MAQFYMLARLAAGNADASGRKRPNLTEAARSDACSASSDASNEAFHGMTAPLGSGFGVAMVKHPARAILKRVS